MFVTMVYYDSMVGSSFGFYFQFQKSCIKHALFFLAINRKLQYG